MRSGSLNSCQHFLVLMHFNDTARENDTYIRLHLDKLDYKKHLDTFRYTTI